MKNAGIRRPDGESLTAKGVKEESDSTTEDIESTEVGKEDDSGGEIEPPEAGKHSVISIRHSAFKNG